MTIDEIKKIIRKVTEEDTNLLRGSYSSLDTFSNCPLSYQFKYRDEKYPQTSSLAMDIGTICHLVLELKGKMIMNNEEVDYDYLKTILYDGYTEITEKNSEPIWGITSLKRKYWEEWSTPDNKSGMTYDEKIVIFENLVLTTRMENKDWTILGLEVPFEFVYDNKIIIKGFIDRVDINKITNEIRITDYKTSKAVYPDTKIKTPLQHFIYDLACVLLYDKLPQYHEYDFVLINKIQGKINGVCSKGYLKRGKNKLDKLIVGIENGENAPKPTPLCYWCSFNEDTPHGDKEYKGTCKYNSLWTPMNNNFGVKNPFGLEKTEEIRKLIF